MFQFPSAPFLALVLFLNAILLTLRGSGYPPFLFHVISGQLDDSVLIIFVTKSFHYMNSSSFKPSRTYFCTLQASLMS